MKAHTQTILILPGRKNPSGPFSLLRSSQRVAIIVVASAVSVYSFRLYLDSSFGSPLVSRSPSGSGGSSLLSADVPLCPFCKAEGKVSSQAGLESSVIECEACGHRYEFIPGNGSFPIEEDLAVHVSDGLLGPRVVLGTGMEGSRLLARTQKLSCLAGILCCIVFLIVLPILASLLLLLFG